MVCPSDYPCECTVNLYQPDMQTEQAGPIVTLRFRVCFSVCPSIHPIRICYCRSHCNGVSDGNYLAQVCPQLSSYPWISVVPQQNLKNTGVPRSGNWKRSHRPSIASGYRLAIIIVLFFVLFGPIVTLRFSCLLVCLCVCHRLGRSYPLVHFKASSSLVETGDLEVIWYYQSIEMISQHHVIVKFSCKSGCHLTLQSN